MINVIGGTYREIDYDNLSYEIFGSGFRACKFLLENNCNVNFITIGNADVELYLETNRNGYPKFNFDCINNYQPITFKYSFSLDNPLIFPSTTNIDKINIPFLNGDNIVCFGMLEGEYTIKGKKVVYDPQTTIKPKKFTEFGETEELIYIINKAESESISGYTEDNDIKRFFFEKEKAKAVIIKNGPYGATVFLNSTQHKISSYVTPLVNKIGSGDIFTASFSYYWIEKGLPIEKSAELASLSTAYYCDLQAYIDTTSIVNIKYTKYTYKDLSTKQVYIAAPFFSLAELILVDKIRSAFLSFGVKVFSPFHDIGLGNERIIAEKDIEGLTKSDIIFSVFDNLDAGTLVESGYAFAKNKLIIGYHRTCAPKDLLMLTPSNTTIFTNLTTAIYQTIWNL
ncbi:PfkB family carbohydrate kinase [Sphingobacterium spiritivorum]|uniref:PfkB family carbohydrate kinase n=1 Tax=Sphingobacterium spiritivorum TaxID=258 RepID=UPI003DA57EC2